MVTIGIVYILVVYEYVIVIIIQTAIMIGSVGDATVAPRTATRMYAPHTPCTELSLIEVYTSP